MALKRGLVDETTAHEQRVTTERKEISERLDKEREAERKEQEKVHRAAHNDACNQMEQLLLNTINRIKVPGREYAEPSDDQLINFMGVQYGSTVAAGLDLYRKAGGPVWEKVYRLGCLKVHIEFQNELENLREDQKKKRKRAVESDEPLFACHECSLIGLSDEMVKHVDETSHPIEEISDEESTKVKAIWKEELEG